MSEARAPVGGVRAVVFDLDGTLVDSRPDLTHAVVALRAELRLAPVDERTVEGWIGEGARRLVEKALADAPVATDVDAALARFLALYEPVCTRATVAYPGIESVLRRLGRSVPLAILTNKPERMTRKIVGHFGWSDLFAPVLGGDSLPFRKPDPRGLEAIAGRLELPVDGLVLVGDSRIDRDTARAAGVRFVWVEWGFATLRDRPQLAAETKATEAAGLLELLDPGG